MKAKLITLIGGAVLLASASQAAITLMNQSFTLDGDDSPTINGTAVGGANTTAGVASTWTAATGTNGVLRTDGEIFGNVGSASAFVGLGSLIDDSKNTSSGLFTLTATLSEPTGNNWTSVGFFTKGTIGENFTGNTAAGVGTVLYRTTPALDFFKGPDTGPGSISDITGVSGSQTVVVVLDLTSAGDTGAGDFGSVSFYRDSVSAANLVVTQDFEEAISIDSVGISTAVTTGALESIELTQVPEPSTYAIWAGLMTLGLVLYRRRRIQ